MPFCASSICKYDLCENHLGGSPWHHMNLSHGILRFDSLIHFTNWAMRFQDWDLRQISLVLGQPRVVLWWNFVSPCKPFATIWCCSKASPSIVPWEVPWEVPRQFGVVLGVIICGWVVSHNGGRCCSRVSLSLSFQKSWDDLELCWESLSMVGLWTMVGLVGIKAFNLGKSTIYPKS
jgi:hypothetical protein